MPSKNLKVLIIRFSSIGDIVLTSPVVRVLHEQIQAEVHYLLKPAFRSVVESNPYIKKLWFFEKEKGIQALARELRKEDFDVIIDLHNNIRSNTVSRLIGVRSHSFHKLNIKKWVLVNFKIDWLPDTHIVDRYFATVQPLGVENDGLGLDFFIDETNNVSPASFIKKDMEYGIFALGAAHYTKQVPETQLVPLLNQINHPVLLVGGPSDLDLSERLMQQLDPHVYSAVGKTNLQQTASLVKQASYVMTPDTGVMHMAAAFRKPIVVFWGNTVDKFGMYPYYGSDSTFHKSIEVKGLACRPCSKIGYEVCPKGHFLCMKAWDPLKVAEEIKQYIVEMGLSMHH